MELDGAPEQGFYFYSIYNGACLVNDGDVTGVPARKLSLDLDDFSPPFRVE